MDVFVGVEKLILAGNDEADDGDDRAHDKGYFLLPSGSDGMVPHDSLLRYYIISSHFKSLLAYCHSISIAKR